MKVVFLVGLCLCLGYFIGTDARKLPSYIKGCYRNDPALNECALKNGRAAIPSLIKGDPKYKIPVFDPLLIERLTIDDKGNKAVGLIFTCEKCKIIGLKDTKLEDIRIDIKKLNIEADFFVPLADITGKYNVSGKVLVLPIRGSGDVKMTLKGVKVKTTLHCDLYKKKDGKEYLKVTDTKFNATSEGFQIHLTNLFEGEKNLGDTMNIFLNENGQELIKTFGPTLYKVFEQLLTNLFNSLTDQIPFDEIFLPK